LNERIEIKKTYISVCLPNEVTVDSERYNNWASVLVGWGSQFRSGAVSLDLLKTQLTIFDTK